MKRYFFTFVTVILASFISLNAFASKYEDVMQHNLDKMNKAQSVQELSSISATFFRVSEKEKDEWLPVYYAIYSQVKITFFLKDGDEIDKHLDIAQDYMNTLIDYKPEESEVHVLQALIYSRRITNAARGMKYSMLSNSSLDKAQECNNKNPRVYYCRGNNVFYTPSMFGGGKSKAKPLYEKATTLFEVAKTDVAFWPMWGLNHTSIMLKKCNED